MPIIQQFHLGAQATVSTSRLGLTQGHKIVIVNIGGTNQSPTYDIEEAADAADKVLAQRNVVSAQQ